MNHCLSLEQVSDELIEDFNILNGNFDTVSECRYDVPSAKRYTFAMPYFFAIGEMRSFISSIVYAGHFMFPASFTLMSFMLEAGFLEKIKGDEVLLYAE